MKKFLILGILLAPTAAHALPATLTVSAPAQVVMGQVFTSTVTINVGSGLLGAADFVVTFDTTALQFDGAGAVASQFQNAFYLNTSAASQGSLHLLPLNSVSTSGPTGSVAVASMTFTPVGSGTTTLNAQVNIIVDTQPVVYAPVTVSSSSISIQSTDDHLPPRTTLDVSSPSYVSSSSGTFISSQTLLGLSAVDDRSLVGDGLGVGVKDTQYSLDGGSFTIYTSSFNIVAEGTHTLTYFSEDLVNNVEVQQSTSLAVDNTPPVTHLTFTGPIYVDTNSVAYLSATTQVNLVAQDPVSGGVASGVGVTYYSLDVSTGSPNQHYYFPFTIPAGSHTFSVQSIDNLGNAEGVHLYALVVDTTPPVSTLSAQPSVVSSGTVIVSSSSMLGIAATDSGSGVQQSLVSVDTGSFQVLTGSFSIAAQGPHSVHFFSTDNIGNRELTETTTVFVDITPPEIQVLFAPDGVVTSSGQVMIDTATHVTITANDALAGVAFIGFSIDSAAFHNFTSTFTMAVGVHTMQVEAENQVGDWRIGPPFMVTVDTYPPGGSGISGGGDGGGIGIIGSGGNEILVPPGGGGNPSVQSVTTDPPSPVGKGTVNFTITFSEVMNTSVSPSVAFTLPDSTVTVVVNQTNYSGNTWTGSATITPTMPSGTAALSMTGAVDPQSNPIPNSLFYFDINLQAPPPPVNVVATLNAIDQLAISWQNGLGSLPASYNLYRATSSISNLHGLTPLRSGIGTLGTTDAPPAISSQVYYAVTAVDSSNNESGPSSNASFVLPYVPVISSPTDNSSFQTLDTSITFNIDGLAEPGALVQIALNGIGNVIATGTVTNGSYSIPVTLPIGNLLLYASAQSETTLLVSSATDIHLSIAQLPGAPTGLSAAPGDTVVDLNWNRSTNPAVTGYNIYRDSGTVAINGAPIPMAQITFRDFALTDGRTYNYRITALDPSGESPKSAPAPAVPAAGPGWGIHDGAGSGLVANGVRLDI